MQDEEQVEMGGLEVPTKPVLMSAENPDGWKLEELLDQLRVELAAKSDKIRGVDHPAAALYLKTNHEIDLLLARAANYQREAVAYAESNPMPRPT